MLVHIPVKCFNHTLDVLMPTIGIAPRMYGVFRLQKDTGVIVPCLVNPHALRGPCAPDCMLVCLDDVAHASASQSAGRNQTHVQSVLIREQLGAPEE